MAARFPKAAPIETVTEALKAPPRPDHLGPMLRALSKLKSDQLGPSLLAFYSRLPEDQRPAAHLLLEAHADSLTPLVEASQDLGPIENVVLQALLGDDDDAVIRSLIDLEAKHRLPALRELLAAEDLMRRLPWRQWLEEDAESYGEVAAELAARIGLRELAPSFRKLLQQDSKPYLVRTLGELGDRESVPLLVDLLTPDAPLEPLVLESLGRIGGPEARQALHAATGSGRPQRERLAFRALARCATEEDDAIFRQAVRHSDWYVRLSCAEVLGRFSRPENLAALAQLAADPVPIVAQRALSYLDS